MKSKFPFLILICLLLACHKDSDLVIDEEILDPPVVEVTTKLVSQTDTTVTSARHALQSFAGTMMTYPAHPFIVTAGIHINRDFELNTLQTNEGVPFSHVATLVENDVNYHHWMIPLTESMQGHTNSALQADLPDGNVLYIPSDGLQTANGLPYEGGYTITYTTLDPKSDEADAIPSFIGFDTHQHHALEFTSCYFVYASSSAGEKLNFSSGAVIQFLNAIDDVHWKFNAEKATWHRSVSGHDHQLSLSDAVYYATAQPFDAVRVSGTLLVNGHPAPHQKVLITQDQVTRTIYTTNKGAWACYLAAEHTYDVEVPLPCQKKYTTTISIPSSETHQVHLEVTDHATINSLMRGTLRNSEGGDIADGILLLEGTQAGYLYAPAGKFLLHVPVCQASTIQVQGLDVATDETGHVVQWNATDTVDVYSVFACQESRMEYLSLTVNGDRKMYWDLTSSINTQSRLVIEEDVAEQELDFQIAISGMTERMYEDTELNIRFEDQKLGASGYSLHCPTSTLGCGFTTLIITHYPDQAGQWIRGYFEGEFWVKTFRPLTVGYKSIRGEFQVYRDF